MKRFEKTVVGVLVASFLIQPLGLISVVRAETVNMEYTDPNHLHAPSEVSVCSSAIDCAPVTYEYDANGNLTNDGEREIEWNQDNKPIRITRDGVETRLYYDASGRRVLKKSGPEGTDPNTWDNKITYVSDSYQESTIDGQQSSVKYYFANGRVAVRNTNTSTGEEELTFLHQDHLGSTILATDSDSQPTSNSLSYFPYGNHLTIQPFSHSSYLFTGQESDPESDLYNYNARLYNPTTGVFISADSVQGPNRYAYAANNPMMFVDPSGHDAGGVGGYEGPWIGPIPDDEEHTILPPLTYEEMYPRPRFGEVGWAETRTPAEFAALAFGAAGGMYGGPMVGLNAYFLGSDVNQLGQAIEGGNPLSITWHAFLTALDAIPFVSYGKTVAQAGSLRPAEETWKVLKPMFGSFDEAAKALGVEVVRKPGGWKHTLGLAPKGSYSLKQTADGTIKSVITIFGEGAAEHEMIHHIQVLLETLKMAPTLEGASDQLFRGLLKGFYDPGWRAAELEAHRWNRGWLMKLLGGLQYGSPAGATREYFEFVDFFNSESGGGVD